MRGSGRIDRRIGRINMVLMCPRLLRASQPSNKKGAIAAPFFRRSSWKPQPFVRHSRPRSSAICTAFRAAPLRRLSDTTEAAIEEMEKSAEGGGLATMRVLRTTLLEEGFYNGAKSGPYDATIRAATIAYLESMNEVDR